MSHQAGRIAGHHRAESAASQSDTHGGLDRTGSRQRERNTISRRGDEPRSSAALMCHRPEREASAVTNRVVRRLSAWMAHDPAGAGSPRNTAVPSAVNTRTSAASQRHDRPPVETAAAVLQVPAPLPAAPRTSSRTLKFGETGRPNSTTPLR
jgi:hypothetical protein